MWPLMWPWNLHTHVVGLSWNVMWSNIWPANFTQHGAAPALFPLMRSVFPTLASVFSLIFLYSYLLGSKLCRKEFLTFSRVLEECWACSRLTDMNNWRHGYWALHPVDSGKASFSPKTNSAWGPLSLGRAYVTALGVWTLTSFIMNSPM